LVAATATFALDAVLWFQRSYLLMGIPSLECFMLLWHRKSTYQTGSDTPNQLPNIV
jgi:hypothetical protein